MVLEAHKLPPEQLAIDIARIHPKIFDNVEAAIRGYPHDLDLLAYWLANRALKDVQKGPDTENANVRTRVAE